MRLVLSAEAEWYDLVPGIRVQALPLLSSRHEEAMQTLIDTGLVNTRVTDGAEAGLTVSETAFGLAWAKAVAQQVIVGWEGVEDPDGAAAASVTPENISAFLDHPLIYQKFGEVYMARFMLLGAEKNVSAPSPSSNSEEGAIIANTAVEFVRTARGS